MSLTEQKVRLNIGCPKKCSGFTCIDTNPREVGVIKGDGLSFLHSQKPESVWEIYSKNMLEHLPNPGSFFQLAYLCLKGSGKLRIITDNAEFFPFYIPLLNKFGVGAHARNDYVVKNDETCNSSTHFMVFTKLHLQNFLEQYGFELVKLNRMKRVLGARLDCQAIKISGK